MGRPSGGFIARTPIALTGTSRMSAVSLHRQSSCRLDGRPEEMFYIPILLAIIISAMMWLSRRQFIPFFWHGLQLFMAFELLPQSLASLVKPFGKPLLKINPVTAKGKAAMGRRVDVRPLICLLVIVFVIVTGLVRAGHDERLGGQPLEMAMLLFWMIYEMIVVTIACFICFEPWYQPREERSLGAWTGDSGADHEHVYDRGVGTPAVPSGGADRSADALAETARRAYPVHPRVPVTHRTGGGILTDGKQGCSAGLGAKPLHQSRDPEQSAVKLRILARSETSRPTADGLALGERRDRWVTILEVRSLRHV
jgi:hypothetical protein